MEQKRKYDWFRDADHFRLPKPPETLSTPEAAGLLGITPRQLRRLMKRLGIEPVGRRFNGAGGPKSRYCPLWPADRIQALKHSPEVADIRERARKRKEGLMPADQGEPEQPEKSREGGGTK